MSRYAPVVPIQIAEQLQGSSIAEDLFGDYHLILAHDVLAHPEDYKRVYETVRARYPESFIILDNSIVELGHAMEMEDLLKAAEIVRPDCIVIPDVMGKGQATRDLAKEFCRDYHQYTRNMRNPISLMGVLQGSNVTDCLETYKCYCELQHIAHLGVPRVIAQQQGSRIPLMVRLSMRSAFGSIHLLGFSDDLLDDVSCARMPIVRGIDSAVPVRAGINIHKLTLNYAKDYGPRGNYWESRVNEENQYDCVQSNIEDIRNWINPKVKGG